MKKSIDASETILHSTVNRVELKKDGYFFSEINRQMYKKLKSIAVEEETSPLLILLSAINVQRYKYSGQKNVLLDIYLPGMNVVSKSESYPPLRMHLMQNDRFITIVQQSERLIEAIKQNGRISGLQENSDELLTDALVAFQFNMNEQISDLLKPNEQTEKVIREFDIRFNFFATSEELKYAIKYNVNKYSEDEIIQMGSHFVNILKAFTIEPYQTIGKVNYLSDVEKQKLLIDFNQTKKNYPETKTLIELFEEQVSKTPQTEALIFEETRISYRELNEKANQLAHFLKATYHFQPDDLIGLKMTRSEKMIVGMLAILKTGAGCVPIDDQASEHMVSYILEDSGCKYLLDDNNYNTFQQLSNQFSKANIERSSATDSLAYVIYTSGSTGEPKGVSIELRGIVNQVFSKIDLLQLEMYETFCHNSKINFVGGTWQLWTPLLMGKRLVVCSLDELTDMELLLAKTTRFNIQILEIVPSQLNHYLYTSTDHSNLKKLKTLLLTGEMLSVEYVRKLQKLNKDITIWNGYGQTECSNDTTCFKIPKILESNAILIGKPIQNTRHYILDQNDSLVPVGILGEICTSGHGVARGYLNRKELTTERFTSNPFEPGQRMFRTGDLGKWLPDGNIEIIGRRDNLVKVRGYRIELGEVEQALRKLENVEEAVVIARNDGMENVLIAYLLSHKIIDLSELRRSLRKTLHSYMIPTYFVQLDHFPLTANGKLNKKALPDQPKDKIINMVDNVGPVSDLEKEVAKIWCTVLKDQEEHSVGIKNSFFEYGGHSLSATRLLTAIRNKYNVHIGIKQFFDEPTIDSLTKIILACGAHASIERIPRIETRESYPLSYAQKRVWILSQFEEDSISYNMPQGVFLKGKLNMDVFKKSLHVLIKRHESLRTVFKTIEGEVRQIITDENKVFIEYMNYTGEGAFEQENKMRALFKQVSEMPFDLEKGPLVRIAVAATAQDENYIFVNEHHIVSDGWSQGVLVREFCKIYNAILSNKPIELPELRLTYKDYAGWHNTMIESNRFKEIESYWLKKFADKPNGIDMPLDFTREVVQTFNGGAISFSIDKNQFQKIKQLCNKWNVTPNMYFLSVLGVLLYKYSGQKDIIIGSPIAGRKDQELYDIVGFFVNTIVFRFDLDPEMSFTDFLKIVKKESVMSYDHQDYPFDLFIDKLAMARDLTQSPLFNVMLAYDNTNIGFADEKLLGVEAHSLPLSISDEVNISKFDLTFFVDDYNKDELKVTIEYNSDLFKRSTIDRISKSFIKLIHDTINEFHLKIKDLQVTDDEERNKLFNDFNDTSYKLEEVSVQTLFERQVLLSPEKDAMFYNNEKISYQEINKKANRLAHYLRQEYLIKRADTIGISMDRSFDMIISIFAIIKSGGTYLSVDPSYPKARVKHMLKDSRCSIVLIDNGKQELLEDYKGKVIVYHDIKKMLEKYPDHNPAVVNEMTDPLYLMYTSGSTGTPNGAILSHGILSNLIQWHKHQSAIDPALRCLQFTSINFCVSFQEIMSTLCYGGELFLIDEVGRQDVHFLSKYLEENEIQNLYLPFSYLNFLFSEFNEFGNKFKNSLVNITTAGEQLKISKGLEDFLVRNPSVKLHNHYGSSEQHVVTSYSLDSHSINKKSLPPVGKPIANTRIFILDEFDNLAPIGAWGEICVLGSYEFLGYVNNPELTNKKLFTPRFVADRKLFYRSGDIGRYREDGRIELKGRKDSQVKIRGFRVELGEIESRILSIAGVKNTVVAVKLDSGGQKFIVAYVALENITIESIHNILSNCLPRYMVPKLVQLERIPLMPNGKVDHEKLPVPKFETDENKYVPPQSNTEKELVKIWEKVLQVNNVGIKDNFFDIGGDSLKAVRTISLIYKNLNVKLDLINVFKTPEIEKLANLIDSITKETFESIKAIEKKPDYSLSSAQRRLWVLSQFEQANIAFNMPGAYSFEGPLNFPAFETALNNVIQRHESLRTIFKENKEGEIRQFIIPLKTIGFKLHYSDISAEKNDELVIRKLLNEELMKPFSLAEGPLLRATIYKTGPQKWIFSYVMHHIIGDAWSMSNFIKEVLMIYQEYDKGLVCNIPPLRIHYKDYVAWQIERLNINLLNEHKEYWLSQLQGELPVLNLLPDKPRPVIKTYNGKEVTRQLEIKLSNSIKAFSSERKGTLYMGLMAAIYGLIHRYTGAEDQIIGSPISGRQHIDLDNQIGLYLNILPLRVKLDGNISFIELFDKVKQTAFEAYEHQEYPFDQLVEDLQVRRDLSRSALFDIMVILQNTELHTGNQKQQYGNIQMSMYDTQSLNTQFDLTFNFFESDTGIQVKVEYNEDIYIEETIKQLMDHFESFLKSAIVNPNMPIGNIDFLNEEEKNKIINGFNETTVDYKFRSIVELFEEQVFKTPQDIALVFEGKQITYTVLNEQVNQLSCCLRSAYHIKPGDIVGVMLERNENLLISICAILKSGAAYVPIDKNYPKERIEYLISDSGCKLLIDDEKMEHLSKELSKYNGSNPQEEIKPDSAAYLFYTSGSTGKPKGVKISQENLTNFFVGMNAVFGNDPQVILAITNYTFDISILELIWPLTAGHRIILHRDPKNLINLKSGYDADYSLETVFEKHPITMVQCTPSMGMVLNETLSLEKTFASVKTILFGGEKLPLPLLKSIYKKLPHVNVYNMYGPTETTIWSTCGLMEPDAVEVTIGKPIANTQVYILDKNKALLPVGAEGEIYIGGKGVANGYFKNEELTKERFFKNPFTGKGLIYGTGDFGKWHSNGHLEYIGRKDDQIKIYGHRIEIKEIELALQSHKDVKASYVTGIVDTSGNIELIAYVILKKSIEKSELEQALHEQLPLYMVPKRYVFLKSFPLTLNGKIDKRKLPIDKGLSSEAHFVEPGTKDEKILSEVWKNLLNLEKIGVKDNFFDLGGNSIKAMRLQSILNKKYGYNLKIQDIFNYSTIEKLAGHRSNGSDMLILSETPGVKRNIYFIAPIFGTSVLYKNLSSLIKDEFNSYGFQYKGIEKGEEYFTSIEDAAIRFSEHIKNHLEETKELVLFGYSMGAVIAYEMVKFLEPGYKSIKLIIVDKSVNTTVDSNEIDLIINEYRKVIDSIGIDIGRLKPFLQNNIEIQNCYKQEGIVQADIYAFESSGNTIQSNMQIWKNYTHGNFKLSFLQGDHWDAISGANIINYARLLNQLANS